MRKNNKNTWRAVVDQDGALVAMTDEHGKMQSIGYSDESPPHVALEIRAAELALGADNTLVEHDGYMAHLNDQDIPEGGEAGWLEREIALVGAHSDLIELIAAAPGRVPSDPNWQDKVRAECDAVDEQTRHDVAASVARHADWDQLGESLDTIDQSEPTPAPEAPLHDVHSDDEPTHVGTTVDDRFDATEVER